MSLFDRLLGGKTPSRSRLVATIEGPGTFPRHIVGESHYQDALNAITGGKTPDGVDMIVDADLILTTPTHTTRRR